MHFKCDSAGKVGPSVIAFVSLIGLLVVGSSVVDFL